MIGSRCWMLGSRESLLLIIISLASLGFGGNLSHCSLSIFPPSYLFSNEIVNDIHTMLCPIKVNSNTTELTVHTSCYCV